MPHPSGDSTPRPSDAWPRVAAIVLVLAGFVAWANSFSGPFVFDDRPAILANSTLDHFATALAPPRDGGTVAGRPLVNVSLWLNRAVSGTEVWSYHAFNLLVHVSAALVLFGLIRRTLARSKRTDATRATSVAFAATLLWTVHPLQTAAVTYMIQRAESLMGLALLLTLYAFARGADVGGAPSKRAAELPWLVLSIAACAAGMAAKEVMFVAPLLVLLYDRTFVSGSFAAAWRSRPRYYAALAATWALLAWLVTTNAGRSGTAGFSSGVSPWAYALTQAVAIPHYLRLAMWPRGLVFDYGTVTANDVAAITAGVALIAVLVGGMIASLRRAPALGFVGAGFFLVIAPSSSVVPIATQTIAEHRMYVPLAALTVAFVLLLERAWPRRTWWVAVGLAVPLVAGTWARNRDYASAVALWNDTVAKRPNNARAHSQLGNALTQAGRAEEALAQYEMAVRLAPGDAWAHNNLANGLAATGRLVDALPHYEAALRLQPGSGVAELNYAQALTRSNRPAEALAHFATADKLGVLDAASHYNYGVALARTRELKPAIEQFRATLRADPTHVGALVNLGNALLLSGDPQDAIEAYETALRLRPEDPMARQNLARARQLVR